MSDKTKVNLDLTRTGNVGVICINNNDVQLAKKIDLYATIAWAIEPDYCAGWEYFIFFAKKLGLDYMIVWDNAGGHESCDKEYIPMIDANNVRFEIGVNYEVEFRKLLQQFHDEEDQ